ncbi:MAG: GHKL domain-containing protein [Clostridiales Family XIII bacterium]|nr:GHKL domain-containing protein [Clostridiales Family XIII bacterium]
MDNRIVFVLSILEWLTVYFLMGIMDKENQLSWKKLIGFTFTIAFITSMTNACRLPFHSAILMGCMVIGFMILTRAKFLRILSDVILSSSVFVLYQLIITIVLKVIVGDITENGKLLFVLLVLAVILAKLVGKSSRLEYFLERYYRQNRGIILIIIISLAVLASMVTHIIDDKESFFWENHLELLILTIIYAIINVVLAVVIYQNAKNKERLRIHEEHAAYMQGLNKELRRREHEYKNHLNAIIGIGTCRKDDPLQAVIDYTNKLLATESQKKAVDYISDNLNVASFISYERKRAAELNLQFNCYIEKPFPAYKIPDFDMIELLANLINNAFEATAHNKNAREIYLIMETNQIRISNSIEDESLAGSMSKIGVQGYSRKGAGRGYGVSNILAICNHHNIQHKTYIEEERFIFELNFQ